MVRQGFHISLPPGSWGAGRSLWPCSRSSAPGTGASDSTSPEGTSGRSAPPRSVAVGLAALRPRRAGGWGSLGEPSCVVDPGSRQGGLGAGRGPWVGGSRGLRAEGGMGGRKPEGRPLPYTLGEKGDQGVLSRTPLPGPATAPDPQALLMAGGGELFHAGKGRKGAQRRSLMGLTT